MGPKHKPAVVPTFQRTTIQTRRFVLNRSSMLPAMTTEGTADAKPVTKRPTQMATGEGIRPMRTQNTPKDPAETK